MFTQNYLDASRGLGGDGASGQCQLGAKKGSIRPIKAPNGGPQLAFGGLDGYRSDREMINLVRYQDSK